MFVFKPTKQTYSDPVSATFLPGIPFGREKSRGDICLLHEGFAASKIFLNSLVLREAILNSKDFLEEVLDIKITDKSAKDEKVDLKVLARRTPGFVGADLANVTTITSTKSGGRVTAGEWVSDKQAIDGDAGTACPDQSACKYHPHCNT